VYVELISLIFDFQEFFFNFILFFFLFTADVDNVYNSVIDNYFKNYPSMHQLII